MVRRQLEVESYDVTAELFVGTQKQCKDRIAKRYPSVPLFEEDETFQGFYAREDREMGICLITPVTLRTVLHECWHLTRGILAFRDAQYPEEFDEHAALLHEHVTSWVLGELAKAKLL